MQNNASAIQSRQTPLHIDTIARSTNKKTKTIAIATTTTTTVSNSKNRQLAAPSTAPRSHCANSSLTLFVAFFRCRFFYLLFFFYAVVFNFFFRCDFPVVVLALCVCARVSLVSFLFSLFFGILYLLWLFFFLLLLLSFFLLQSFCIVVEHSSVHCPPGILRVVAVILDILFFCCCSCCIQSVLSFFYAQMIISGANLLIVPLAHNIYLLLT